MQLPNGKPLPVLLVGNKCDIPTAEYNKDELDQFCRDNGFIGWFATSAKENTRVEDSVRALVRDILTHKDAFAAQAAAAEAAADGDAVALGGGEDFDKPGCCS